MTAWEQLRIPTNGIELSAYRAGPRATDQPALVLLHGITDSGRCWGHVADVLAADFPVIALDARGHGFSAKPEQDYSPHDHAADVAGVIDALALDRPVLIGHSMGADVAALVAAEYPAQVRALVLEDPPWYATAAEADALHATYEERVASGAATQTRSLEELMAPHRAQYPLITEDEHRAWAEAKHQVSLAVNRYILAERPGFRDLLARITCPLLLVTGDPARGALVTPDVAAAFIAHGAAHGVPMQVKHISTAGHCIRRTVPNEYLNTVVAFLAALPA